MRLSSMMAMEERGVLLIKTKEFKMSTFNMSGKELAVLLGLTEGTHSDYNEWVTVMLDEEEVKVPLKTLGCGVSYDALAAVGLEEGVTLSNGDTVRLMTSGEWDTIYVKELYCDRGYTDTDLGVGVPAIEGSATWVVDDTGEGASSDTRVLRGYFGVSNLGRNSASNTNSHRGWRVVLIPSAPTFGHIPIPPSSNPFNEGPTMVDMDQRPYSESKSKFTLEESEICAMVNRSPMVPTNQIRLPACVVIAAMGGVPGDTPLTTFVAVGSTGEVTLSLLTLLSSTRGSVYTLTFKGMGVTIPTPSIDLFNDVIKKYVDEERPELMNLGWG